MLHSSSERRLTELVVDMAGLVKTQRLVAAGKVARGREAEPFGQVEVENHKEGHADADEGQEGARFGGHRRHVRHHRAQRVVRRDVFVTETALSRQSREWRDGTSVRCPGVAVKGTQDARYVARGRRRRGPLRRLARCDGKMHQSRRSLRIVQDAPLVKWRGGWCVMARGELGLQSDQS